MRILLTGSSGMVGRNLIEHPSASNFELLTPSSNDLDLMNQDAVADYIRWHQPDLVIHAAGKVGGIQANMSDPVGFLIQNSLMGIHVINEANNAGIKYCINLASSCMYPREAKNPIKEDQILTGELEPTNEGYALAKITTTRLCQYISHVDAQKTYTTLIPCNLFGPYDKFDTVNSHMIPAVIRKIYKACEADVPNVEIWGDGEARREFMYVEDLADCIFTVIDKMANGVDLPNLINIGIGTDYCINDYYNTVADVLGYKGEFIHDLDKPVGMHQKLIDSSRIRALGWKPKTSLHDGIKMTYQHFLKEVNNE